MKQVIDLLGKKVSFGTVFTGQQFVNTGIVTDVVISLNNEDQFSLDDGDFYKLSEVKDFILMGDE